LRKPFGLKSGKKQHETGENYIARSFIIYTVHGILE
jgi:hypothetical protein